MSKYSKRAQMTYSCSTSGCKVRSTGEVPQRWNKAERQRKEKDYVCTECLTRPGDPRLYNYPDSEETITLCADGKDHSHFIALAWINRKCGKWSRSGKERYEALLSRQNDRSRVDAAVRHTEETTPPGMTRLFPDADEL
jgi:hypothetical protein